MGRRSIVLYWLLLAVPTVLVAGYALRLLRHEGDRIARQAMEVEEERLRAIGEQIQLAVATVEDELTAHLRTLDSVTPLPALLAWQDANPLVRHVFVWDPAAGLLHPRRDASSTGEERRFVTRYDALFARRQPWVGPQGEGPAASSTPFLRDIREMQAANVGLAEVARRQGGKGGGPAPVLPARAGWAPWLSDNRLSLLGWVQCPENGRTYGMELEFAALLSRLVTAFPRSAPAGGAYALLDDAGGVVHQTGDVEVTPGSRPRFSVSLSPHLPHWQVAAYWPGGGSAAVTQRGLWLAGGILVGIFAVAILAGGFLLMRLAHLSMLDAARKTTFVANVSHELRTPLTSIRMYAELLAQNRVSDENKRARCLGVIATETERLTRLVNNVLDFSRLEQGRKKYDRRDLDLGALLAAFVEAHRVRIEAAGLRLEIQAAGAPPLVWMDRDAVEQALLNLVENAVKYAAAGQDLTLEIRSADGCAELSVSDRGPGVAPKHRRRIFEKFYRVDDSLTARQPGAGLGLSIARALMRDQGGDLVFEPRPGGGSRFTLRFPPPPASAPIEGGNRHADPAHPDR